MAAASTARRSGWSSEAPKVPTSWRSPMPSALDQTALLHLGGGADGSGRRRGTPCGGGFAATGALGPTAGTVGRGVGAVVGPGAHPEVRPGA